MLGDPVVSRFGAHSLDRALNEPWPPDAATTPDRPRIPIEARVGWKRAGEESIQAYATRWSGRSAVVTPRSTSRAMSSDRDFDAIIRELALADYLHQATVAAGCRPAEQKAWEARKSELIAKLDELRGMSPTTYEQFRDALEAGAGCEALFEIRNRMDPHDPLKAATNDDLRNIGCHYVTSTRSDG